MIAYCTREGWTVERVTDGWVLDGWVMNGELSTQNNFDWRSTLKRFCCNHWWQQASTEGNDKKPNFENIWIIRQPYSVSWSKNIHPRVRTPRVPFPMRSSKYSVVATHLIRSVKSLWVGWRLQGMFSRSVLRERGQARKIFWIFCVPPITVNLSIRSWTTPSYCW